MDLFVLVREDVGELLEIAKYATVAHAVGQQFGGADGERGDVGLVQLEYGVAEDGQEDDEGEAEPGTENVLVLGGGAQKQEATVEHTGDGDGELHQINRLLQILLIRVWGAEKSRKN